MSKIEWTEKTWNPVLGCKAVSPGCRDCYAGTMGRRIVAMGGPAADDYAQVIDITEDRGKLRKGAKAWNGRAVFMPDRLDVPLRRKRPTVYMAPSMSDFFHEDISFQQIAAILGVMAATPQHTYQVLTKRPERLLEFLRWVRIKAAISIDGGADPSEWCWWRATERGAPRRSPGVLSPWPLPNVWFGTSVEDQRRADERLPLLAQVRAMGWHTFVSVEPLLGPITTPTLRPDSWWTWAAAEWVIVGGESGSTARRCEGGWIRRVRDEAHGVGCQVFVKQLGLRYHDDAAGVYGAGFSHHLEGSRRRGSVPLARGLRSRKGNKPEEWPENLRVFEMPDAMVAALGERA